MNHVDLIGRLTKDPELNVEHTPRVNFSIAVDRYTKNGDDKADFIRCVAFGSSANTINDCFYKGRSITISGRLENNPFTDKDGKKRDSYSVIVERWEFPQNDPQNKRGKNEHAKQEPAPDSFEDIQEDVPF